MSRESGVESAQLSTLDSRLSTAPSEFDLIARHFTRSTRQTALGIGDDAALIEATPGKQLAVTSDLLVEGTHFLPDVDAATLGWKTLAVNVSDLAAMGARPRWATLALTLPRQWPQRHPHWLTDFAEGFFACAERYGIDLVGGDTTSGPAGARSFCVTLIGEVAPGHALRRDGARPGDLIWVSGHPGRAALGLAQLQGRITLESPWREECVEALLRPVPRLELGIALVGLAHAAIDVSDGLLGDLRHILERSQVAARLRLPNLPAPDLARDALLGGGDDYELLFTTSPSVAATVHELAATLRLPLTPIGVIVAGDASLATGQVVVCDDNGVVIDLPPPGYDHFSAHG